MLLSSGHRFIVGDNFIAPLDATTEALLESPMHVFKSLFQTLTGRDIGEVDLEAKGAAAVQFDRVEVFIHGCSIVEKGRGHKFFLHFLKTFFLDLGMKAAGQDLCHAVSP